MATISSRLVFVTTSPRTLEKVIPEIALLSDNFSGQKWNADTQTRYMELLRDEDFFHGEGCNDPAFSARDTLNVQLGRRRERNIRELSEKIRNREFYDDIQSTFDLMRGDHLYDAPLIFEYSEWLARKCGSEIEWYEGIKSMAAGWPDSLSYA